MAFNSYVVKELLKNGFPVISIGFYYNNYQNHKVILKDIIHNIVLNEKITGNFELETHVSIIPVYFNNVRTYSRRNASASYTYVVRFYLNRRLSDIRNFYRLYVGKAFTLLGPANVYFYLGTVTGRDQGYGVYEDITYYNYSCKYPAPGYNENPTVVRLYGCCEGIAYGERRYCFSGVDFGSILREVGDNTYIHVISSLFIDIRGRVVAKNPVEDIMQIRASLYFLFFTFFNFYHVEHVINRFTGLPVAIPPPMWLVPIGELGFIRYKLNNEGKITYDFLPLTYFFYGIFTNKNKQISFGNGYRYHRYGYARGSIGTLYIEGTGCSIPVRDYWEEEYYTTHNGMRDRMVIPQIDTPQNLYVFKEKNTTRITQRTATITGDYHRYLNWLEASCSLANGDIHKPVHHVETVFSYTPAYYWQGLIPPAYLYRPALVFLTKANRLLYINPRT